ARVSQPMAAPGAVGTGRTRARGGAVVARAARPAPRARGGVAARAAPWGGRRATRAPARVHRVPSVTRQQRVRRLRAGRAALAQPGAGTGEIPGLVRGFRRVALPTELPVGRLARAAGRAARPDSPGQERADRPALAAPRQAPRPLPLARSAGPALRDAAAHLVRAARAGGRATRCRIGAPRRVGDVAPRAAGGG